MRGITYGNGTVPAVDPADYAAFDAYETKNGLTVLDHKSPTSFSSFEEQILLGSNGQTRSGISMGPEQALRVSAAFACRRAISEGIAKLPMSVRRVKTTKTMPDGTTSGKRTEELPDHPVDRLLTERPNHWQTPFEFIEYMVATAVFHRGAYALIHYNERTGHPEELLPLLPNSVNVWQDEYWRIHYTISGYGENYDSDGSNLIKLIGPPDNTLSGHSVVMLGREAIALAQAIEGSQARFHQNDLRPSGVLTTKALGIKKEVREEMARAWQEKFGPGGTGGVAVLDGDFEFKPMTAGGVDSQVIENRKFQIEEICRFFGVAPSIIFHSSGSIGYNGLEQVFSAHGHMTLAPWVKRLEQVIFRDLLADYGREFKFHIDIDSLLRGTPSDQATYYDKAVKIWMTPNEVRIAKGFDPIDNDPDMDRVQLQRNNTGTQPGMTGKPASTTPAATTPAKPATQEPA